MDGLSGLGRRSPELRRILNRSKPKPTPEEVLRLLREQHHGVSRVLRALDSAMSIQRKATTVKERTEADRDFRVAYQTGLIYLGLDE